MQISNHPILKSIYNHSKEVATIAAILSNPVISTINTAIEFADYLFPNFIYDFDEYTLDADGYLCPFENKLSEIKSATSFFNRYAIDINPNLENGEKTRKKIMTLFEKHLSNCYDLIQDFNHTHDSETKLAVIVDSDYNLYTPFTALGGSFSYSDPCINLSIPEFTAQSESDLIELNQEIDKTIGQFNPAEDQFILARELIHLQKNDNLPTLMALTMTTCASIWPWVSSYSNSSSWFSYLLTSSLQSMALGAIAYVGYSFYDRKVEMQTDLEAIDYLKTAKGAKSFFEKLIKIEEESQTQIFSLESPPLKDRLKAVTINTQAAN